MRLRSCRLSIAPWPIKLDDTMLLGRLHLTRSIAATLVLTLSPLVMLFGCSTTSPVSASDPAPLDPGQRIAMVYCEGCHAVGRTDDSRRSDAPALRSLPASWNYLILRRHLRRPDAETPEEMQGLNLSDSDLEDLSDYLDTLH